MSNKKGSAPPRYDEEFKKAMALVTEKGIYHYINRSNKN